MQKVREPHHVLFSDWSSPLDTIPRKRCPTFNRAAPGKQIGSLNSPQLLNSGHFPGHTPFNNSSNNTSDAQSSIKTSRSNKKDGRCKTRTTNTRKSLQCMPACLRDSVPPRAPTVAQQRMLTFFSLACITETCCILQYQFEIKQQTSSNRYRAQPDSLPRLIIHSVVRRAPHLVYGLLHLQARKYTGAGARGAPHQEQFQPTRAQQASTRRNSERKRANGPESTHKHF
jgi:hypothetical protein